MKSSTKFFTGFLLGAAAGAIAGVLFAPDKGSKTRQTLGKRMREYADEYGLELDDLMDTMGVPTESETETVSKVKSPAKKVVTKTKKTPTVTKKTKKVIRKPKTTSEK
jgi:gas vesicle protein